MTHPCPTRRSSDRLALAVARKREDVTRFAEQIERLEHQHQRGDDHERPHQEHPHHVEGHGARREEARLAHARALRRPSSQRVTPLASLAKAPSSPPHGWPPGATATGGYTHSIHA